MPTQVAHSSNEYKNAVLTIPSLAIPIDNLPIVVSHHLQQTPLLMLPITFDEYIQQLEPWENEIIQSYTLTYGTHSKTLSFVLPDNFGKKTYGKTMDFFSTSSLLLSSTKLSLKNDLLKIDFEYHSKVNQKK